MGLYITLGYNLSFQYTARLNYIIDLCFLVKSAATPAATYNLSAAQTYRLAFCILVRADIDEKEPRLTLENSEMAIWHS